MNEIKQKMDALLLKVSELIDLSYANQDAKIVHSVLIKLVHERILPEAQKLGLPSQFYCPDTDYEEEIEAYRRYLQRLRGTLIAFIGASNTFGDKPNEPAQ